MTMFLAFHPTELAKMLPESIDSRGACGRRCGIDKAYAHNLLRKLSGARN